MPAKKQRRTRSSKLDNDEIMAKFWDAIAAGASETHAAAYAGINRSTMTHWKKLGRERSRGKFKDFADRLDVAEAEAAVGMVVEIRNERNPRVTLMLLARRFPDEYGKRADRAASDDAFEDQKKRLVLAKMKAEIDALNAKAAADAAKAEDLRGGGGGAWDSEEMEEEDVEAAIDYAVRARERDIARENREVRHLALLNGGSEDGEDNSNSPTK